MPIMGALEATTTLAPLAENACASPAPDTRAQTNHRSRPADRRSSDARGLAYAPSVDEEADQRLGGVSRG